MPRTSTDARSSDNDLKITFEAGGESVSIYVDPSELNDSSRKQLMSEFSCALCCTRKSGFAACMARCLLDGMCCDGGTNNCERV